MDDAEDCRRRRDPERKGQDRDGGEPRVLASSRRPKRMSRSRCRMASLVKADRVVGPSSLDVGRARRVGSARA